MRRHFFRSFDSSQFKLHELPVHPLSKCIGFSESINTRIKWMVVSKKFQRAVEESLKSDDNFQHLDIGLSTSMRVSHLLELIDDFTRKGYLIHGLTFNRLLFSASDDGEDIDFQGDYPSFLDVMEPLLDIEKFSGTIQAIQFLGGHLITENGVPKVAGTSGFNHQGSFVLVHHEDRRAQADDIFYRLHTLVFPTFTGPCVSNINNCMEIVPNVTKFVATMFTCNDAVFRDWMETSGAKLKYVYIRQNWELSTESLKLLPLENLESLHIEDIPSARWIPTEEYIARLNPNKIIYIAVPADEDQLKANLPKWVEVNCKTIM